jgi:hypothetical protein
MGGDFFLDVVFLLENYLLYKTLMDEPTFIA